MLDKHDKHIRVAELELETEYPNLISLIQSGPKYTVCLLQNVGENPNRTVVC